MLAVALVNFISQARIANLEYTSVFKCTRRQCSIRPRLFYFNLLPGRLQLSRQTDRTHC